MKIDRFKLAFMLLFVAAAAVLFYLLTLQPQAIPNETPAEEEYHVHADFTVFVNGVKYDFAREEFMEKLSCGKPGEEHIEESPMHMHDLNGGVLHIHDERATLGMFFSALNMSLDSECIVLKYDGRFCVSGDKKLRMFVNGAENSDFEGYEPRDLDKILVTYGSESSSFIRAQYDSIPSQACIYSGKCPTPPGFVITPESCGD